jgi:hypothetical protein
VTHRRGALCNPKAVRDRVLLRNARGVAAKFSTLASRCHQHVDVGLRAMTKLTLMFIVIMGVVGCGKKEDKPAASGGSAAPATGGAKAAPGGDCLVGTYEHDDAGKIKKMIFNADKTGADDKGDGTSSKFTWSLKDDKTVHIVYPAEGDSVGGEFDMPFNCANGTFYTLYKKKQ